MRPCLHVQKVLTQDPSLPCLPEGDPAQAAPVHGWLAVLAELCAF